MKVAVTLSVDHDVKKRAMVIIQKKLGSSMSSYINEKLKELILSHDTQLNNKQEVKQNANNKRKCTSL